MLSLLTYFGFTCFFYFWFLKVKAEKVFITFLLLLLNSMAKAVYKWQGLFVFKVPVGIRVCQKKFIMKDSRRQTWQQQEHTETLRAHILNCKHEVESELGMACVLETSKSSPGDILPPWNPSQASLLTGGQVQMPRPMDWHSQLNHQIITK